MATGCLAESYGLRPAPFLLGAAHAALGLGLSTLAVRKTRGHVHYEASRWHGKAPQPGGLSTRRVFTLTSFKEPALSAACQAGLVNNLNDAVAWGSSRFCSPRTG
jgi:hypothetical protein